jgi:hypothetical protein
MNWLSVTSPTTKRPEAELATEVHGQDRQRDAHEQEAGKYRTHYRHQDGHAY